MTNRTRTISINCLIPRTTCCIEVQVQQLSQYMVCWCVCELVYKACGQENLHLESLNWACLCFYNNVLLSQTLLFPKLYPLRYLYKATKKKTLVFQITDGQCSINMYVQKVTARKQTLQFKLVDMVYGYLHGLSFVNHFISNIKY